MIFWMPQLLKTLSSQYSNTKVGILVMIPYVAALPTMLLVSRSSDRALERRYHAAVPEAGGAIALLLLGVVAPVSPYFSVVLWCCVAMGVYSLLGPFWALPSEFLTRFSAATGMALINSVGTLGGFIGPYALGAIRQRTGSFRGGLVLGGISLFASA